MISPVLKSFLIFIFKLVIQLKFSNKVYIKLIKKLDL